MRRPRGLRFLLVVTALSLTAASAIAWQEPALPPASKLPDAQEINAVLQKLAGITGFRVRRQLPFQLLTRDQINLYIKAQIKQSVRPKDIYAEELSLKKLGFVSPDFDLKQTTIDLLTEQAAAFYDFHKKKLFISEWAAASMRQEALVHELAHALADQNFNIEKYMNKDAGTAEESLARQAVVEGQASWLTLEYSARESGRTLSDPDTATDAFRQELDPDDPQFPVFSKAPLYLRGTMLFPYQEGQSFQQALVKRDGAAAFGNVFRKPPASTSQIMHPELYFEGTVPLQPVLPKPTPGMKSSVRGVFGEEDAQLLLRQYTSAAIARGLAPGLRGGIYRIDEDKKNHRTTLVFATEWSDTDSATAFLNAYRTVLEKKWKHIDQSVQEAAHLSGRSEDGYYDVVQHGSTVTSREGFAGKL